MALAFHFGLWVSSVQSTELSHALLFVNATPVVLAAAALLRGVRLSRGELAGTAGAMAGALILASDASKDSQARANPAVRCGARLRSTPAGDAVTSADAQPNRMRTRLYCR